MTTPILKLIEESWTTSTGNWGNRFLGNFYYIDALAEKIVNAKKWIAGTAYVAGDIIIDPTSKLILRATGSVTAPAGTTLIAYLETETAPSKFVYIDDYARLLNFPASVHTTISITFDPAFCYIFKALTGISEVTGITGVIKDSGGTTLTGEWHKFDDKIAGAKDHTTGTGGTSFAVAGEGYAIIVPTNKIGTNIPQAYSISRFFDGAAGTFDQIYTRYQLHTDSAATGLAATTMELSKSATSNNDLFIMTKVRL